MRAHARRSVRPHRPVRPVPALAALLLAAALALTGCSDAGDSGAGGGADKAVSDADARGPQGAEGAQGAEDEGRRSDSAGAAQEGPAAPSPIAADHVIRTASLTVRVDDVPGALARARTATEDAGGYVGEETTERGAEGDEYTRAVLRVPAESYEEVLAGLEGTGTLLERDAKARDVTDQVVDVESRVKSQRASVARVRELMDRATGLSDVVTLEGELSTRQAELEALLARQASLKDRTSLATITLSLTERPEARAADDDPGFTDALAGGWDAFLTMLRWLAVALGAVLPFAAVAALLVVAWLRLVRPRLRRRPAAGPAIPAPGPLEGAGAGPGAGAGGRDQG
ncbi:DUF4349 domain-containing protein [Streptomyces ziwulingensis]|uniref:DUF4349 domain-containing protein n=1 Tax=Streptomyces ziwulingensis TaxID=1045501 RepID=A0ABP9C2K8_9ACTN